MDMESRVHDNTTLAGFTPRPGPGKSLKPWPGPWTRKELKTVACLPQVESGRRVFPPPCLVRDFMSKTMCLSPFPWKRCGQDPRLHFWQSCFAYQDMKKDIMSFKCHRLSNVHVTSKNVCFGVYKHGERKRDNL